MQTNPLKIIYIVVHEDRHFDTDIQAYDTAEAAVLEARERATEAAGKWGFVPDVVKGRLCCFRYGEDDRVYVIEQPLQTTQLQALPHGQD